VCSCRSPELGRIPKKDLLVHQDSRQFLLLISAEDPSQCTYLRNLKEKKIHFRKMNSDIGKLNSQILFCLCKIKYECSALVTWDDDLVCKVTIQPPGNGRGVGVFRKLSTPPKQSQGPAKTLADDFCFDFKTFCRVGSVLGVGSMKILFVGSVPEGRGFRKWESSVICTYRIGIYDTMTRKRNPLCLKEKPPNTDAAFQKISKCPTSLGEDRFRFFLAW